MTAWETSAVDGVDFEETSCLTVISVLCVEANVSFRGDLVKDKAGHAPLQKQCLGADA
jgi:hypothetical protein